MTARSELLRSALLEALFVVLGVVLALSANEWRQHYARQQAAKQSINAIVEELHANKAAVEVSLSYHSRVADSLVTYFRGDKIPSISLFSQGFMFPADVYSTAWETATQLGTLSHSEYDEILRYSRIYSMQEAYKTQTSTIGPIIYSEMYQGGAQRILNNYRNLLGIIRTMIYRETQLLESYKGISSPDSLN